MFEKIEKVSGRIWMEDFLGYLSVLYCPVVFLYLPKTVFLSSSELSESKEF